MKQLSLALLPACLFVIALAMAQATAFDLDPDYEYLLNGLNLFTLHAPWDTSHPGTTLHWLAAIVIGVTWLWRWPFVIDWPVDDVLRHPEFYLLTIHTVIVALVAAAVFFCGSMIERAAGLMSALAAQAVWFVSFPAIASLPRVTPEPMIIALAAALIGVLAPHILDPKQPERPIAAGILIGAGLALKITTVPWVLLLLLFDGRRTRRIALVTAALAALAITLPIAGRYGFTLAWFESLAVHRGIYGEGEVGLPRAAQFGTSLLDLLWKNPEYSVAFIASLGLAIFWARYRRIFLICAAVIALQLVVVAKHPNGPAMGRYLQPAMVAVVLATAAAVAFGHRVIASTVAAALIAVGIWHDANLALPWFRTRVESRKDNDALLDQTARSGCLLVVNYAGAIGSQEYKLAFGDAAAGFRYASKLSELYPNFLTYDFELQLFQTFGRTLGPVEADHRLAAAPCVNFVTSPTQKGISSSAWLQIARTNYDLQNSLAVYRRRGSCCAVQRDELAPF
jgi:hypothetical protein